MSQLTIGIQLKGAMYTVNQKLVGAYTPSYYYATFTIA